jgi:hypothetical protein
MKYKIIFIILLITGSMSSASAQIGLGCTIKFDYDAAGNRIKRMQNCQQPPQGKVADTTATQQEELGAQNTNEENIIENTNEAFNIAVLYPNPTNGNCIVSFNMEVTNAILTITDQLGRITETQKVTGKNVTLHLSGYPSGVYKVTVQFSGQTAYKTVIRN